MKQFTVIGLGNFGFYLAVHLYEKGHEVLAIDLDSEKAQTIKEQVSQAVIADGTDRAAMEALGVAQTDAAVVCIGTHMSNSILTTLNLKDIGVKRVVAKATSEQHGRILEKIGASEVLFPEKDLARTLAERLHNPNMLDYLPFVEDHSIIQLAAPSEFEGKSLRELDLTNRYGVQVIAIKETVPERVNIIPTANYLVKGSDLLLIIGPNDSLDHLREMEPRQE
jgi:trk system potassium uptake protein TrkA